MKKWVERINWDWVGVTASLLCAVHCAALPFLLTLSALGGLAFLDSPILEYTMICLALGVAAYALTQSYRKDHRKKDPLYIALLGFALIFLGQLPHLESWEALVNAMGGVGGSRSYCQPSPDPILLPGPIKLKKSRPSLQPITSF